MRGTGEPEKACLEETGGARLDELAADRLQKRVRHCRDPGRAEAAKPEERVREKGIAGEAPEKRPVVVVDGEHEAEMRERGDRVLRLEANGEAPVSPLPDARESRPARRLEDRGEDSVAEDTRRIASRPRARGERVGRPRNERRLEDHGADDSLATGRLPPSGAMNRSQRAGEETGASGKGLSQLVGGADTEVRDCAVSPDPFDTMGRAVRSERTVSVVRTLH